MQRADCGGSNGVHQLYRTDGTVAGTRAADMDADADLVWETPAVPPRDHCAQLRKQFGG